MRANLLAWMLAIAGAATGAARAATVDFRFGAGQFRGDFGSDADARLEEYPLELSFNRPATRLTLTLPYVRIDRTGNVTLTADGPAVLGAGGPGRPPYQTGTAGEAASGRGDLRIRDEIFLSRAGKGKRAAVAFILDLKVPSADETKGLGTGRRDWGVGLSYMKPLSARWQILGQGIYRFMGDPEGIDFRNGARLSGGLALVARTTTWRAMFESVPPILDRVPLFNASGVPIGTRGVEDRRIVRADLTVRSQPGGTTRLGLTKGLSDSAEDLGVFLEFSTGGR